MYSIVLSATRELVCGFTDNSVLTIHLTEFCRYHVAVKYFQIQDFVEGRQESDRSVLGRFVLYFKREKLMQFYSVAVSGQRVCTE